MAHFIKQIITYQICKYRFLICGLWVSLGTPICFFSWNLELSAFISLFLSPSVPVSLQLSDFLRMGSCGVNEIE